MPFFDLPLSTLQTYRPERSEPADYESFWAQTLAESRRYDLNPVFEPYDAALTVLDVYDVTFSGYGGQRVKGWYMRPRGVSQPLPCIVEFIGYGGGRGLPHDRLLWPTAGYATLVMDTRGQGSSNGPGDTPDLPDGANPFYPGFMTQGVLDPQTYYYRRVYTDAVRAIETARSRSDVDGSRITVTGGSQGGGISIAAAALVPDVEMCVPDVPFLCDFRRAVGRTDKNPYQEISHYLSIHRGNVERVFKTLDYFDGLNFAPRIRAKTFFSVALMDDICPPSTVYATYNYIAAPKDIRVYSYNNHEGGGTIHNGEKLRFVRREWGG